MSDLALPGVKAKRKKRPPMPPLLKFLIFLLKVATVSVVYLFLQLDETLLAILPIVFGLFEIVILWGMIVPMWKEWWNS